MQVRDISINQNKMETTRHGSFSFPLAVYRSVMKHNVLGFVNWHWHEELQFCRVTEGSVRFFVSEKQYLLHKGDGIFVNGGYLHMAKPEGNPNSTYICLDFSSKLLSAFPGSVFENKYVAPFLKDPAMENIHLCSDIPWQKDILDGVSQIYSLCEKKCFGYELEAHAILGRMWLGLLGNKPKRLNNRQHKGLHRNTAIQAILTYISQHYSERITIEMIAQEVVYSASECCRIFKKVTGETIFAYLKSYRHAQGTQLLRDTNRSISHIAYEIGFCSTSYFIEVFKEQFEMTPLQYRKHCDNEQSEL